VFEEMTLVVRVSTIVVYNEGDDKVTVKFTNIEEMAEVGGAYPCCKYRVTESKAPVFLLICCFGSK